MAEASPVSKDPTAISLSKEQGVPEEPYTKPGIVDDSSCNEESALASALVELRVPGVARPWILAARTLRRRTYSSGTLCLIIAGLLLDENLRRSADLADNLFNSLATWLTSGVSLTLALDDLSGIPDDGPVASGKRWKSCAMSAVSGMIRQQALVFGGLALAIVLAPVNRGLAIVWAVLVITWSVWSLGFVVLAVLGLGYTPSDSVRQGNRMALRLNPPAIIAFALAGLAAAGSYILPRVMSPEWAHTWGGLGSRLSAVSPDLMVSAAVCVVFAPCLLLSSLAWTYSVLRVEMQDHHLAQIGSEQGETDEDPDEIEENQPSLIPTQAQVEGRRWRKQSPHL